jgi:hypothetical protein
MRQCPAARLVREPVGEPDDERRAGARAGSNLIEG